MPQVELGALRRADSDAAFLQTEQFLRRSRKYWIPLPCIPHVLSEVHRHVPVHHRGVTHSVYFDSATRELYSARLIQAECAQLIRFRWYGDDSPRKVWVERKTHRTRAQSSKSRFALSPTTAMRYASGDVGWRDAAELTGHHGASSTTAHGASESSCSGRASSTGVRSRELAAHIFHMLHERQLRPCVRTEYYRTAFESNPSSQSSAHSAVEGDCPAAQVSSYRVTVDESVRCIDDSTLLDSARRKWAWPMREQLGGSDAAANATAALGTVIGHRSCWQLPVGVLELKLQGGASATSAGAGNSGKSCSGADAVGDIDDGDRGTDSDPLIAINTGTDACNSSDGQPTTCASDVSLAMAAAEASAMTWLAPLIDKGFVIPAPKFSKYLSGCAALFPSSVESIPSYMPALECEASRMLRVATAAASQPALAPNLVGNRDTSGANAMRVDATNGSDGISGVVDLTRRRLERGTSASAVLADKRLVDRGFRYEPKTFMANERTFLSWMRSLLPIGAIGLALLRIGFVIDGLALILFTVVGTAYAARKYRYRFELILGKVASAEAHHDHFAVPAVTGFFCLAFAFGVYAHGVEFSGSGLHSAADGQGHVIGGQRLRGGVQLRDSGL